MPGDAEVEAAKVEEKPTQEAPEEPAKELEGDAPKDTRAKANVPVEVDMSNATMNVMPSCNGKMLMTLGDGGFQYLAGAVRANVGVKSGRYLFEVKIVECRSLVADSGRNGGSKHSLLIGIAGANCPLFLGENGNSCAFDNEGLFMQGRWKNPKGKTFGAFDVVGLLVNLDAKSPNANTVSLFVNGVRASDPLPIPESLRGKAVFPTLNFKNMTLHTNFGPSTLAPLPFKCHMLQDAAKADVEVLPKKSGKKEIVFPVGLPDEGTFRFVDGFLEENAGYTELSDRAMVNWARNSGVWQAKNSHYASNDRPGLDFGIRDMEESQLKRSLTTAASYYDRSCVAMEVKNNLLSEERKKALEKYDGNTYKKVAVVAMGEPPKAFKAKVLQELLDHKKWLVATDVKRRRQAEAKEKAAKKAQAAKEKAAKEREARAAARKAANEAADKKEEAAEEEKKEDDVKEEEGAVKVEGEDDKMEVEQGEDATEEKEKEEEEEEAEESLEEAIKKAEEAVTLTDEEKALCFPPAEMRKMADVTSKDLSSSFSSFSIPTKEEGFDEVRFAWASAKVSEQYLQAWIKERKLTQRVEDLQPGTWFREQQSEWQKLNDGWRSRQSDWNDPAKRERNQARKAAAEEARKNPKPAEGEEGEEKENKENEEDEPMPAEPADSFDANDVDAFDAENIDDLGNGEPLYAHFAYEDWTLLTLRFQLHLLVHAYAVDMNDPERSAFTEPHLEFYFKKYFKNEFNMKYYNCSTFAELMELIPDVIEICQSNTLGPLLSNDTPMDNFVRLTEESRRERLKVIDAGDESAVLKFSQRPVQREKGKGGKDGKGKQADRSGYGRPVGGMAPAMQGRPGMGASRMPMMSRATYGAPQPGPPGRAGYGQGPQMMHGPPPGMYGPGYGMGPPPPGYGMGPPPGYGAPPPGYGRPPPGYGGGGPPPGMHGQKRGAYGPPPGGAPPGKGSRGSYGGDRGRSPPRGSDRDRGSYGRR